MNSMTSGELAPAIGAVLFGGGLYAYAYYLRWQLRRQQAADPKNEKGR
jgi:hypothetical protein